MILNTLINSLFVIVASMFLLWVLSVLKKNASIVDIFWGFGFVIVAWASAFNADRVSVLGKVVLALVSFWGLRLSIYLGIRNHGKPEDFRYVAMRKHYGPKFPIISLFTVFMLQGAIMMVVSLPVQIALSDATTSLSVLSYVGIALFALGIFFEAVGDWQLAQFKRDPQNVGQVMQTGLWKYTRHPNYFGDACVWWGLALIAAETGTGAWGIIGAVVMTVLLRRVSGVTLLEKSLKKRREGYEEYIRRTSPFVPRPPKRV